MWIVFHWILVYKFKNKELIVNLMANSTLLLLSLFKGSYEYCNHESVIIINTQWNDLNSFYESDFMYVLHKTCTFYIRLRFWF